MIRFFVKLTTIKTFLFLKETIFVIIFCCFFADLILAQANFVPLREGDVNEYEEVSDFIDAIKLNGNYHFYSRLIDTDDLPERRIDQRDWKEVIWGQELRLMLGSKIHRVASIRLDLEIDQELMNDADLRQDTGNQDESDSQQVRINAHQAYLQYKPNPNAAINFGKQYINIGDRRGKVFSGVMTGIAQRCGLGTWKYEVGATKTGNHRADWMYFISLEYPAYSWGKPGNDDYHRLNFEVFRIFYTERDIPLGVNNVPVKKDEDSFQNLTDAYESHDETYIQKQSSISVHQVDRNGIPIYYDSVHQEYFGLRIMWDWGKWSIYSDLTANQGKRYYHLQPGSTSNGRIPDFGDNSDQFKSNNRAKKTIAGLAFEAELKYIYSVQHLFRLRGLLTGGDKEKLDSYQKGNNFLRSLKGYFEIIPGNYKGNNFYFNSGANVYGGRTGLGHSVNNTKMLGFIYKYSSDESPFFYKLGLFKLDKTMPVYNESKKEVTNIGVEVDNTLSWKIDKYVNLEFELNLFQEGEAFTLEDNQTPTKEKNLIVHGAAHLFYFF